MPPFPKGRQSCWCYRIFTVLMSALLLLPSAAQTLAQKEAKRYPFHYIRTHKVLLLSDLITIGASAAESVTSQQCLNAMGALHIVTSNCAKQGYMALKMAPFFVIGNHLAYHYAPDPGGRFAVPIFLAVLDIDLAKWTSVNMHQTYWLWKTGCYPCFSAVRMPQTTLRTPSPSGIAETGDRR
jgi:hypothetical protein